MLSLQLQTVMISVVPKTGGSFTWLGSLKIEAKFLAVINLLSKSAFTEIF